MFGMKHSMRRCLVSTLVVALVGCHTASVAEHAAPASASTSAGAETVALPPPDADAAAPRDSSPEDAGSSANVAEASAARDVDGGAAVAHVAPPTGAYSFGVTFDPGMSHQVLTLVILRGDRLAQSVPMGRWAAPCGEDIYARLLHGSPRPPVLLGVPCSPPRQLVVSPPVVIEVVRQGDRLIARHGLFHRGHPVRFDPPDAEVNVPAAEPITRATDEAIERATTESQSQPAPQG
jgi:hypothetical protein